MERFLNAARWIFVGRSQRVLYTQCLIWGVLATGITILWFELKPEIKKGEPYLIRSENILICNPPPWISNDFVTEALKYLPIDRKLGTLNAFDSDLVEVLTLAFAAHPWVSQVEKIEVFYPAQIKIRLKFRQPVAIVDPALATIKAFHEELDVYSPFDPDFLKSFSQSERLTQDYSSERYVVDETGYRLPDEYLQNNKNAYAELPVLCGVYWGGSTSPGSPLDNFMEDSALFASFLKDCGAFEKFGIEQIFILRKIGQTRGVYFLRTKENVVCLWGYFTLDRETRTDETYSGERNTPKREESKKKLFEEQRIKLERWGDAFLRATRRETTNPLEDAEEATNESTGELKPDVYFSVASEDELFD